MMFICKCLSESFFARRVCLLTGLAVGKSKMAMMDGLGQPE